MNIKIKFGLIALSVIVIQSVLKFIGVIVTGSLSFISETIDTFIDIFFIALTLYSVYVSQKPADYEHMFGHGKIDSIGALIQGIILVNIYGFLIFNAIQAIINQNFIVENASFGLQILIISFILNLVLSRILIWQGKKNESLSLKMQGLNMFQDSLRALLVIVNFIIVIFFEIRFLDPIFSIILSCIIVLSALKLGIDGIQELIDINPVKAMILEEMKKEIFNLEHVNGVRELRVRASSGKLFLDVNLAVEDHISIVHADEISKNIRSLVEDHLPNYNVETIIEMSPLGGEKSLSENIINIIYSLKQEFQNIFDITNLDVFRIENEYFVSLTIIVQNNLTLTKAH
ncbi:MAG: cation diffusion facilitator family transporter, partial [Candidatus Lokiarchaeota archaeon]|nr:cation diffusion facilitator family transporter [Candidatus Lokiarchaeota archaeon]MBD3198402.1 cation diffusion facilitator family transporter [Candidatus Lokiarchaeota archaeon]